MKQLFAVLAAIVLVVAFAQGAHLTGSPAISATPLPSPTPNCGTPFYTPTPNSPVNSAPMAQQLQHVETCTALAIPGPQLKSLGAVCDGVTDDSAIINGAPQFPVYLPFSNCFANESLTSLPLGRWVSGASGVLLTEDSAAQHQRAPSTAAIPTPPAYTGSNASIVTAFDGDFSKVHLAWETNIVEPVRLDAPLRRISTTPMKRESTGFIARRRASKPFPIPVKVRVAPTAPPFA